MGYHDVALCKDRQGGVAYRGSTGAVGKIAIRDRLISCGRIAELYADAVFFCGALTLCSYAWPKLSGWIDCSGFGECGLVNMFDEFE